MYTLEIWNNTEVLYTSYINACIEILILPFSCNHSHRFITFLRYLFLFSLFPCFHATIALQIGRSFVISKLKDYPKFQAVAIAIQRSGFKVCSISSLLSFLLAYMFFFSFNLPVYSLCTCISLADCVAAAACSITSI